VSPFFFIHPVRCQSAELPTEQPEQFRLVINARTAKVIAVSLSPRSARLVAQSSR
jgi:hypothetical protein